MVRLTPRIALALVLLMVVGTGLVIYGVTLSSSCETCTNDGSCSPPPCQPFDPVPIIALGAVALLASLVGVALLFSRPRTAEEGELD